MQISIQFNQMSSISRAYDHWSGTYDGVVNKTRDLDEKALQSVVGTLSFSSVLELGCGTGKNTVWLAKQAAQVVAVDFSEGMLEKAKEKVQAEGVKFIQADITKPLPFDAAGFDMATCNLILEHVQDLEPVFTEAARVVKTDGHFFISELHPFKQYTGSKARFGNGEEVIVLDCFLHHVSDYLDAAKAAGLELVRLDEWFDEDNRDLPRLLSLLFKKRSVG